MLATVASLSLAAVALALPVDEGVRHIALPAPRSLHHADGSLDHEYFLHHLNHTLLKYRAPKVLPDYGINVERMLERRSKAAKTATEQLLDAVEDGDDELFYGNVVTGIGEYAQTWQIDFDTGSSDFFVPGPNCSTTAGCYGTQRYNEHGTDEKNVTMVTYGSGEVIGENYLDYVSVAGIQTSNTNVVSLTTAAGFNGPNNGLMGMAFYSIASSDTLPYFYQAMDQGKVALNEFAFQLGRAVSNTANKGALTIGGVAKKFYYGAFTQVPVTDQGYWQVLVESLNVNHTSAGATTMGQAAIDTGTTIVLGPTDAIAAVYAGIPGSVPLPLGGIATFWAVPCDVFNTTSFGFVFGGAGGLATPELEINPLDMNFGPLSEALPVTLPSGPITVVGNNATAGLCLSAVGSADVDPTENLYIIGDTFIKNWYTKFSFDNYNGEPSVSFAKSRLNQPPKKKA